MSEYERFGTYRVYECIGAGGMATVHRATIELEDGGIREVALKRLLPQFASDRQFVDDFVREAQLVRHLHHPNIARVLELGRRRGTYFIAMELVRGVSLMKLLQRGHRKQMRAPIGVVLAIARELCGALQHAHEATDDTGAPLPIVHRDLTPSNLLVTDDGHLKVIDFGVAKALAGAHQTSSGLAKGKLGYMSMEALGGKQLDTRADIFSAGVVLWELLTGQRLFWGQNEVDVIVQIRSGRVPRPSKHNPDCPRELDDIVRRALAREPDDRWPSAAALAHALDDVHHYHPGRTDAGAVVAWRRALQTDPGIQLRVESDNELTSIQMSSEDAYDELESIEVGEVAEGSRRAEPLDDLEAISVTVRNENAKDPARPKFQDADTVITADTILDRKP